MIKKVREIIKTILAKLRKGGQKSQKTNDSVIVWGDSEVNTSNYIIGIDPYDISSEGSSYGGCYRRLQDGTLERIK
jgi:hypothetical protein